MHISIVRWHSSQATHSHLHISLSRNPVHTLSFSPDNAYFCGAEVVRTVDCSKACVLIGNAQDAHRKTHVSVWDCSDIHRQTDVQILARTNTGKHSKLMPSR